LDGTLVNSLEVMKAAYFKFLDEHERRGSQEEFDSLTGPPLREVVLALRETHEIELPSEILYERYIHLIESTYPEAEPAVGAENLLRFAQERDWSVSIVTSNSHNVVQSWLEANRIGSYFQTLITQEDVARGKPHPEPYLQALQRSGCSPSESFAIEDSPQGATSAVSAGLPTIALSCTPAVSSDWPEGVTFVSDLIELERLFRETH